MGRESGKGSGRAIQIPRLDQSFKLGRRLPAVNQLPNIFLHRDRDPHHLFPQADCTTVQAASRHRCFLQYVELTPSSTSHPHYDVRNSAHVILAADQVAIGLRVVTRTRGNYLVQIPIAYPPTNRGAFPPHLRVLCMLQVMDAEFFFFKETNCLRDAVA